MEKLENTSTPSKKDTFLAKLKGKQKNGLEEKVRHIKDTICAGTSDEEVTNSLTIHKHNNYLYEQYEIVCKLSGFLNTCLERESLMHQVNNELIEAVKGMSSENVESEVLSKIKEFSDIHQESFQALRSAIDIWHEIRNTMEVFAQESQKINISYIIYDESEYKDASINIQNILKDIIGTSPSESVKTRLKDVSNQFKQVCDTIEKKEKEFWRKQQQFSQITWKMQQLNNLSDCLMQEYKHNKSKVDDLVKFASQLKKQLQKSEEEKLEMVEKLQKTKDFQNNEIASSNGMQLVQTMKDELMQYRNTVNTLKTRINTLEQQLQNQQTSGTGIDFNDMLGLWHAAILQTKQINEDVEQGLENSALNTENFQNSLSAISGDVSDKILMQDSLDGSGLSPNQNICGQAISNNLESCRKVQIANPAVLPKLPVKSVKCRPQSPKQTKKSKSPSPHRKHISSPTRCKSPSETLMSPSVNTKYCPHTKSQCNIETCNLIHSQSEKEKHTGDVKENDLFNQKGKPKPLTSYRLDVTAFRQGNEIKKIDNSTTWKKSMKTNRFEKEDEKALKDQADWKLIRQLSEYENKIYYLKDHLNHEKTRHEAEVRKAENLFLRSLKHDDTSPINTNTLQGYEKQIHHLQDHLDHVRLRHDAEIRKHELAHKRQLTFLQKDCIQILKNINRFKENIANMFEKEQFHVDAQEIREVEAVDIGLENGTGDVIAIVGRGTPRSLNIFNVVETKLLQAVTHLKYLYNEEYFLSKS